VEGCSKGKEGFPLHLLSGQAEMWLWPSVVSFIILLVVVSAFGHGININNDDQQLSYVAAVVDFVPNCSYVPVTKEEATKIMLQNVNAYEVHLFVFF
jgi:hypothetical protein